MALPMKTMKKPAGAMKVMKSMKNKKVSIIAKGKRAKSAVFAGKKRENIIWIQKS